MGPVCPCSRANRAEKIRLECAFSLRFSQIFTGLRRIYCVSSSCFAMVATAIRTRLLCVLSLVPKSSEPGETTGPLQPHKGVSALIIPTSPDVRARRQLRRKTRFPDQNVSGESTLPPIVAIRSNSTDTGCLSGSDVPVRLPVRAVQLRAIRRGYPTALRRSEVSARSRCRRAIHPAGRFPPAAEHRHARGQYLP